MATLQVLLGLFVLAFITEDATHAQECPAPECPDGWTRFRDLCYHLEENDPRNYTGAKARCEELGAHLATPHDSAENDFLYALYEVYGGYGQIWIACDDIKEEGQFVCWDGTPSCFRKWHTTIGQPDNGKYSSDNEDCAVLLGFRNQWWDEDCNKHENSFFCKRHLYTFLP